MIQVGGPCVETELDDFTVNDMVYLVKTQSESQVLLDVKDSVSRSLGNQDGLTYCGARKFEFAPSLTTLPFVSLQDGEMVLATDDKSFVGEYDITVTSSLVEYPSVFKSTTFRIDI